MSSPTPALTGFDLPEQEVSSLQETLLRLDLCIREADTSEGIPIGATLDTLGQSSFCFATILLSAPFLQPFSLGPFTMISGGVLILTGWQMARGRERLILPNKIRSVVLRGSIWIGVMKLCRRLLVWLSRFAKPRCCRWTTGKRGARNAGWLIFTGGVLLALPCANLPLNNTLPAMMSLFAAVAWLEKDGLFVLLSLGWGVLTILYFALVAAVIYACGTGLFRWAVESAAFLN